MSQLRNKKVLVHMEPMLYALIFREVTHPESEVNSASAYVRSVLIQHFMQNGLLSQQGLLKLTG